MKNKKNFFKHANKIGIFGHIENELQTNEIYAYLDLFHLNTMCARCTEIVHLRLCLRGLGMMWLLFNGSSLVCTSFIALQMKMHIFIVFFFANCI